MSEAIAVGLSVPRADAEEKVRGEAAYVDDMYLPGMLHGAITTSPYPHARILSYNLDQALAVAGVKAILTGDDYDLKRRSGAFIKDEMLLAKHRVRFVGEAVATVAATSLKAAREAARLVEVTYEELPAVLSMDEAIADGAPVIHEDFGDYFSLVPLDGDGNRLWRAAIDEGDVDAAWDQCDVIVEETYETQAQHHAYMEPCGSLAKPDRDGRITVWSACQSVHLTQQRIAEWVGLPMAMVRSIAPKIGGGFGGKGSPGTQPLAAALALKTGKPVKMVLSLTEDFEMMRSRHPARIKMKTGAKADGTLVAREHIALLDCGAYADDSPAVVSVCCLFGRGPYNIPNYRGRADGVYTNKLRAGAFRGFGGPQATFASESQLDELAAKLGMHPVDLRLKNALHTGEKFAGGQTIKASAFTECLERVRRDAEAAGAGEGAPPSKRRGVGYTGVAHVSGLLGTAAHLELRTDGSAALSTGVVDIGQGSDIALKQICAEAMQLPLERVSFANPDSDTAPFNWKTAASRVTYMAGRAIVEASNQVKEKLLHEAAEMMEAPAVDLEIRPGGFVGLKGVPERMLPFAAIAGHSTAMSGGPITGSHSLTFDGEPMDPKHATIHGFIFPNIGAYTFGAQACEVEIDEVTGQATMLRVWSAHDVGRAINPAQIEGQIEGGFVQGMGYALFEEIVWDAGHVANPTLMDYKLPGALDSPPEIHPIILEDPEPSGPFGAKGVGEPPLVGAAAVIGNAIANAIGNRVRILPMTPERVLDAMEAAETR